MSRQIRSLAAAATMMIALLRGDVLLADSTVMVAGAAHATGIAGTTWRTDIWLLNTLDVPVNIGWTVFATGEPTCARPVVVPNIITVDPGAPLIQ